MAFKRFMSGTAGRTIRIVAGIALIGIGLFVVPGVVGWILAAVGLVPLYLGAKNVCLVAPPFGGLFKRKLVG